MEILEYQDIITNELGELALLFKGSKGYSNAIRDLEKVRIRGSEVSGWINEKLSASENDEINYYSTEERLVGLLRVLEDCELNTPLLKGKNMFDSEKSPPGFKVFRYGYSGLVRSGVSRSVKVAYPYFNYANEQGVKSDSDFGKSTLQFLTECNDLFIKVFDEKDLESYENWSKKLIENVREVDFEYELSPEGFSMGQSRETKGVINICFPVSKVYDRIKQEGKIEDPLFRRLLMILWMSRINVTNYSQAKIGIEHQIVRCQEKLEKLKMLKYPNIQDFESRKEALELISSELVENEGFVRSYLKS